MGTDIHLYFERKVDDNWEQIDIPSCLIPSDRNYDVFAFLAGVRNVDIDPQFSNRGLPKDSSLLENDEECFIGEHSFTYAYLDEILRAPWNEHELNDCYFYVFCFHVFPRLCSEYGYLTSQEERNTRVIMGFDN